MKQQKLKLCCLHTKKIAKVAVKSILERRLHLDAIYKTMRYDLPLFFPVVKTNVNCIGVGSFITQSETTAAIQELLAVFHD